jgi:hypothetical protein
LRSPSEWSSGGPAQPGPCRALVDSRVLAIGAILFVGFATVGWMVVRERRGLGARTRVQGLQARHGNALRGCLKTPAHSRRRALRSTPLWRRASRRTAAG